MLRLALLLLACSQAVAAAGEWNLISNGDLEKRDSDRPPAGFVLEGAADYRYLGDRGRDISSWGIGLPSDKPEGAVSCTVDGIDAKQGHWFRFTFRGLPQGNFAVRNDDLYMKVAFFGDGGKVSYDAKTRKIYDLIEHARKAVTVNGPHGEAGAEVWQTYTLEFPLPFPQVDQLRLSVGFDHGASRRRRDTAFLVDDLSLVRIPEPAGVHPTTRPVAAQPQKEKLLPLGGRWFYAAKAGETRPPQRFDSTNADRLLYRDGGYSAPFAGNTSAWLRPGHMDLAGNVLTASRLVQDNVVITFDRASMIVRTHNVPNHPTGQFPEQGFGNRSYVQERDETFYFPLVPKQAERPVATNQDNSNGALHMGPIGLAINGVVFYNPFDMGDTVAVDMMDRCCGHPNIDNQYHYHKYPICVNTPWADEGAGHSPLIGFAFDGYPVYGPFERANVMAKDVKGKGALNAFNVHYDEERGWHYQVTPGQFPYLIGGFWGVEDSRNAFRGRGGREGGAGGNRQAGGGGQNRRPVGGPPSGGITDNDVPPPPDGRRRPPRDR
ncbi:MAG TPA: YHYH protein [Tepidisphaeraceae bacterium]|nr:YHYH protein [Tepidisphaeraceae bacterium]